MKHFDPATYRPDLDKLAAKLVTVEQRAVHDAFIEALGAMRRNGFTISYTAANGGADAAFDEFNRITEGGGSCSVRRTNDYDTHAWTLEVPGTGGAL